MVKPTPENLEGDLRILCSQLSADLKAAGALTKREVGPAFLNWLLSTAATLYLTYVLAQEPGDRAAVEALTNAFARSVRECAERLGIDVWEAYQVAKASKREYEELVKHALEASGKGEGGGRP